MRERAVIYCRVSTDEEEQIEALSTQIDQARECIIENGWINVDEYIDAAKSGTTTKSRDEYKKMYNDMETDLFDIIVIKSQDRLMRSTKDWYLFIDRLVKNDKKLYFYLERKFYTPDDGLITGIRAILAEEFSRDLSKKLNSVHRRRQEKGTKPIITSATWGYDNINKEIVINEKEADIVRQIYALCCEGKGSRLIQKELTEQGIRGRSGGVFPVATIRKIIRNPIYKGTAIMNKYHTNFETKQTKRVPESEWIYHDNIIPAIVTPEIWQRANDLMDTRLKIEGTEEHSKHRIGVKRGNHALSSRIYCGECGAVYWRKYRKIKSGILVEWYCSTYIERGKSHCDNLKIKEDELMEVLSKVADDLFKDRKQLIVNKVMAILKNVLESNSSESIDGLMHEKAKILQQKDFFMDKFFEGTISEDNYKRRDAALDIKLKAIESKLDDIKEQAIEQKTLEARLQDIKYTINNSNISILD